MDALFARRMPRDALVRFLGHEVHHFYRNLLISRPGADCLAGKDVEVFWALDQLQAEGLADQISARAELEAESPPPYVEQYRTWIDETPARLARFQALVLDEKGDLAGLGRAIRETLPCSGHPNGYYMADVILNTFGKKRLVAHVADPIAFVRDYQEAAMQRSKELFVFSVELERYLQQLDERLHACTTGEGS